ncbi:hypothetical protein C4579_01045 [Candidatus Microgenomates bacterium]|nr:MAG: hypothetical protein C4579_01045 [Candidatus Microgenomates bacterium]
MLPKLPTYKTQIIDVCLQFLSQKSQDLQHIPWTKDAFSRLKSFIPNGKTIRGSMVLFGVEMFRGEVNEDVLRTACALEIVQAGALIHDDIIDQDTLRRNQASLHVQYADLGTEEKLVAAAHFGESMAICLADLCFFLSFELLNQIEIDAEIRRQIIAHFSTEMQILSLAEMQDVYLGHSYKEYPQETIFDLYIYKTGRYSFSLPLMTAALLTRQNISVVQTLSRLGELMGLLFQIHDDELSLTGKQENTGKPVGTDIARNNKTLHALYLQRKAQSEERTRLKKIFGNSELIADDIVYVQALLTKYKIIREVNKQTTKLQTEAHKLIRTLPIGEDSQSILVSFLRFLQTRTV